MDFVLFECIYLCNGYSVNFSIKNYTISNNYHLIYFLFLCEDKLKLKCIKKCMVLYFINNLFKEKI